jgi:hypothetical protein
MKHSFELRINGEPVVQERKVIIPTLEERQKAKQDITPKKVKKGDK